MLIDLVRYRPATLDLSVVFLEAGPMVAEIERLGVPTAVLVAGRLRQPARFVATSVRIARLARRSHADCLVGWMSKGHLYSGVAALLGRLPEVWYEVGIPGSRDVVTRVAAWVPTRGTLTLSRHSNDAHQRLHPGVPSRLVYPGIDLGLFDVNALESPDALRRQLGLPRGPLIGTVGRLQRWKGQHTLIAAMPLIRELHPSASVVIVGGRHSGEPHYEQELRKMVSDLGLETSVHIVGHQKDPRPWIRAMDVFVHASHDEPFGIVLLEAMALETPLIATDTAGPAEILRHRENALLFSYDDQEALAAAVDECLGDPLATASRVEQARHWVQAFDVREYVRHWESSVRDLIGVGAHS